MFTRQSAFTAIGAVVLSSLLGAPAHGTAVLHTNQLTFPVPVALPGVTLPPGTYIFEQVDVTTPDIVVVRSRDRERIHYLGFTVGTSRPTWMPRDRAVTLSEPEPGAAPRVTAWYPLHENRGYAFVYAR